MTWCSARITRCARPPPAARLAAAGGRLAVAHPRVRAGAVPAARGGARADQDAVRLPPHPHHRPLLIVPGRLLCLCHRHPDHTNRVAGNGGALFCTCPSPFQPGLQLHEHGSPRSDRRSSRPWVRPRHADHPRLRCAARSRRHDGLPVLDQCAKLRALLSSLPGQKLRLGGDALGADPTYLLHLPFRSHRGI